MLFFTLLLCCTKEKTLKKTNQNIEALIANELFVILGGQDKDYYTKELSRLIRMPKYIEAYPDVVNKLIAAGANINDLDKDGNSVLILACSQEFISENVIEQLLAASANIDQANLKGITALMIAAENRDIEKVTKLLAAGANRELMDNKGKKALDYAQSKKSDYTAFDPKSASIIALIKQ